MKNANEKVTDFDANVLSVEESSDSAPEAETATNTPDTVKPEAIIVDHIMFTEQDMNAVMAYLNMIQVKGVENINAFSEVCRILTTAGMRVPVTINQ